MGEVIPFPDPFDPNTWPVERPDDTMSICLSSRWDLHVLLDRQDYEWAKEYLWCHTYGSGEFVESFEEVFSIARPDSIYARRSIRVPGFTASGRPCYGSQFLHREILIRWKGKPRSRLMVGDHKNGDTLDCRRANLRWATKSQNSRNVPGSKVRARFLKQMGAR